MKPRKFTVTYEHDGEWWVASVRGVRGCHTQGRSIEQARNRIRDALSLYIGELTAEKAQFVDDVRPSPAARRAIEVFQRADRLEQQAKEARTRAAMELVSTYSRRDVGELLHLSHQRIQQLVSAASAGGKRGSRRKVA
jgi:predicted RNase H-like HicB family nuclease